MAIMVIIAAEKKQLLEADHKSCKEVSGDGYPTLQARGGQAGLLPGKSGSRRLELALLMPELC